MVQKNPLYPGYYPGDPQYRPPKGRKTIEPFIDPLAWSQMQELVKEEMDGISKPGFLKERILKDLQGSFKVSAKSPKVSVDPVELELAEEYGGAEESAELPGAFGLDFDFYKFAKDPGKAVKEFGLEAVKKTFDLEDFGRRSEREYWKGLTEKALVDMTEDERGQLSWLQRKAREGIEREGPLDIRGPEVESQIKTSKDTKNYYEGVQSKYINLMGNVQASTKRDAAFKSFQRESINALNAEINHFYGGSGPFGSTRGFLGKDPNFAAANIFTERASAAGVLANLDAALDKAHRASKMELLKHPKPDMEKRLKNLAEAKVKARETLASLSPEARGGAFASNVKELEGFVGGLDKVVGDGGAIPSGVGKTNLHGMLGSAKKKYTGRSNFTGRPKMVDRFYGNTLKHGLDESNFVDALELGGGKRLKYLNRFAEKRRFNAAMEDFLDAATDRGVGAAVWSQAIKPRVDAWTPAFYVQDVFRRTTGFGAVISDDSYGWARGIISLPGIERAFRNNVRIKFSVGAHAVNFISQGGDWAEAPLKLGAYATHGQLIGALNSSTGAEAKKFMKWLRLNESQLGLKFKDGKLIDSPRNFEIIGGLLKNLRERAGNVDHTTKITSKYAGWLQKSTTKLNQLQTKIYNKLGKRAKKILSFRTAVAEAIAGFVSGTLASVTGGLASPIALFVDRVVRFIVTKIYDLTIKMVKKVVTFDVGGALDDAKEATKKIAKACLACCLSCCASCGCFVGIVLFIIVVVLSAIFPEDVTRVPITLDQVGEAGVAGITLSSTTVNCFEFKSTSGPITVGGVPKYTGIAWGPELALFEQTVSNLQSKGPAYIEKLCSGGTIEVLRASDKPGHCGYVGGASQIIIMSQCDWMRKGQTYVDYLFSHETGHNYALRRGYDGFSDSFDGGRSLPTYPGNCAFTQPLVEDFPETIGDYMWWNTECINARNYTLADFPQHESFVQKLFTTP